MTTENNVAAQAGDEPMRAAFEAWFSQDGSWPNAITRNGSGYRLSTAQSSWTAWQACWKAAQVSPRVTADVERDAARHRWHRKPGNHFWLMGNARWTTPEQFDAAIDAAIATTKPGA